MDEEARWREPPRRSSRQDIIVGLVVIGASGVLGLVFLVAAALASNPCGMFGDGCDAAGTTPTAFVVLLALTLVAVAGLIVGVALVIRGILQRS